MDRPPHQGAVTRVCIGILRAPHSTVDWCINCEMKYSSKRQILTWIDGLTRERSREAVLGFWEPCSHSTVDRCVKCVTKYSIKHHILTIIWIGGLTWEGSREAGLCSYVCTRKMICNITFRFPLNSLQWWSCTKYKENKFWFYDNNMFNMFQCMHIGLQDWPKVSSKQKAVITYNVWTGQLLSSCL